MTSFVYNIAGLNIGTQTLDWAADDIRVLLTTAAYAPDKDDVWVADVTGEVTVPGYVRKVLTGRTVTSDLVGDRTLFGADDVEWLSIGDGTQAAARAVVFRQGTSDADSPLVAALDFITPRVLNGGDFTLQFTGGIAFRLNQ
jgi:hypothetical protein